MAHEEVKAAGVGAEPPPQLPLRYWIMVDGGLLSLDKAKEMWAAEQRETGAEFDPLG